MLNAVSPKLYSYDCTSIAALCAPIVDCAIEAGNENWHRVLETFAHLHKFDFQWKPPHHLCFHLPNAGA